VSLDLKKECGTGCQEKGVLKKEESEIQRFSCAPRTSCRGVRPGVAEWRRNKAERRPEGGWKSARVPGPKNGFRIGLIAQRGKRQLSQSERRRQP
jgi:hypothetical protein